MVELKYMIRAVKIIFIVIAILAIVVISFNYKRFLNIVGAKNMKKVFNVVLVGAAGSGKGTQGDLIKNTMNLLQVSAGEVLRQYRNNKDAKYTKTINEYIDKGQLVPSYITHELIAEYIKKNVFCDECKYDGVIYDGFPRQMEQLEFLDKFLDENNNKVDAVVYIDVPMDVLVDRLSGRFSCSKCGTLYHKTRKPTKLAGVCDVCGSKKFSVRADDQDEGAIKSRFKIFKETTMPVLSKYEERNIVIKVDGTKPPKEIGDIIISKLKQIKSRKS